MDVALLLPISKSAIIILPSVVHFNNDSSELQAALSICPQGNEQSVGSLHIGTRVSEQQCFIVCKSLGHFLEIRRRNQFDHTL
jgi:hypothetical protein